MKTKILFLLAWLMATATACSADEPQKELPDITPEEKTEEPTEPSGNKKVLVVYFSPIRAIPGRLPDTYMKR